MADWTDEPCWPLRANTVAGYVETSQGGERILMHRLVYRLTNGPLLSGLEINHLCRRRNCINPAHLEQVSHLKNVEWSRSLRTTCSRNHPWDGLNTYFRKDRPGQRMCRACNKENRQRRENEK